jgi:hypothetical protein
MELSARALGPADAVDLSIDPFGGEERNRVGVLDPREAAGPEAGCAETVVVHVQLRPRRPATRRCLAALAALAARHDGVAFSLTGLGGDHRVVRVTVGVELGPRELVAKFSEQAQAAYAFVDGLFTDLYDHMPVYVAEPGEAERVAAAGVLAAADTPRPAEQTSGPRIPSPRLPADTAGQAAAAARRAVPVPA